MLDLERHGWDALCTTAGADFYADNMTDDGLMVMPGGMRLDKAATLKAMRGVAAWSSYRLGDSSVVELGAGAAALTYSVTANRAGTQYRALMTTVYVRRDGRWKVAFHQQTPY